MNSPVASPRPASLRPAHLLDEAPLEYRLAMDLAMSGLTSTGRAGAGVLIVASVPAFIDEALLCADGPLTIAVETTDLADIVGVRAGLLIRPGRPMPAIMAADALAQRRGTPSAVSYGCALWVSPQRCSWRRRAKALASRLTPGALLTMVTAGPLGQVVSRFRRTPLGSSHPAWLGAGRGRVLSRAGLQPERVLALGGFSSIAWALAARLAGLAERLDLADRAEAGYRRSLLAPHTGDPALVNVLTFRRGGSLC